MRLEVLPVTGIGEIVPGDDLAALIADAAPWLRSGDVLVVTSKVVSKAEGRLVELPDDESARNKVREELLDAETAAVVARRGGTRIVRTRHGFVMAAAGIDNSNVAPTRLVLLPVDPDRSARELRRALESRLGIDVAVIVSDTMGRPWRNGLTDVALGAAGIAPVRDYRGRIDRYGNELRLTQMAVVDELAGAADLVKGKNEQIPVAVVRGYPWQLADDPGDGSSPRPDGPPPARPDGPGVRPLLRDLSEDLFTLGTAEATTAGLVMAATLTEPDAPPTGRVDPAALRRAIQRVSPVIAAGTSVELVPAEALSDDDQASPYPDRLRCRPPAAGPADLVRLGADVHRLRVALAVEGISSAPLSHTPDTDRTEVLLGLSSVPDTADSPADAADSRPPG
ncbi:coenzyme F420-0:L-glutamate ligase [Solwaraspora sp. WMMD406]|uniref:coenzyme F420-0:L-glutamate ligase n=1 Tax=Solwaraspora sp. WMMD406 TaxID=3016095 RepID=UPI002415CB6A|nr:coenzyme F420-0:L-glutamate ligase [Solwaraspora sp. WMMD406]MDG4763887.1 coenzyme F420-0:L-glutamate ligase [Solwaraspora sp. WMMD406]